MSSPADTELLQRLKTHAAVNGKRLLVWCAGDRTWQASLASTLTGCTERRSGTRGQQTALDAALAVWSEGIEPYV
jgi:hypothetical protein